MTPEEALQHPWIQTQDPPAEPSQPLPAPLATWSPRSAVPPANWLSVCYSVLLALDSNLPASPWGLALL